MTRILFIILTTGLFASCSSGDNQSSLNNNNDSTAHSHYKDTIAYRPDTLYLTVGESSPFALQDLKLGKKSLPEGMTIADIVKNKIKTITREGVYTVRFDKNGYKIFEKYKLWAWGSSFQYEFDSEGKPMTISILDTNSNVIGTAKYKYNSQGKLVQAGEYLLKYYPNGLLKSVEDANEIERYNYDADGNLYHINFDYQHGVVGCGNRTSQWKGEYNGNRQLIKDQTVGFPSGTTRYFEYSSSGQIVRTKNISSLGNEKTTTEFIYTGGLLTQTNTFDATNKKKYTTKYIYEKY